MNALTTIKTGLKILSGLFLLFVIVGVAMDFAPVDPAEQAKQEQARQARDAEREQARVQREQTRAAREKVEQAEQARLAEEARQAAFDTSGAKIEAYVMARQFVEGRLRSPGSAKFGSYGNSSVKHLGDGVYEVVGYVDSQNGFGALLRSRYYVKVANKGNDRWSLIDVGIL